MRCTCPSGVSSPLCWHRGHVSGQREGTSAGRLTHPCSWNCLKAGEDAVGSNCIIWAGAGSRWSLLKKKKKKNTSMWAQNSTALTIS